MSEVTRAYELVGPALRQQGVDVVFFMMGLGGPHSPPVQSCVAAGIRTIYVRHEEAAAMMAHAYARMTGKPGVCMTPLGPATTNALTGIVNAWADASPVVLIGGGHGLNDTGREAYQEQDEIAMFRPVTKDATRVEVPERIPELVGRAFHLAQSGRRGPVYLELPLDVIHKRVKPERVSWPDHWIDAPRPAANSEQLESLRGLITASSRPLVLSGSGIIWSGAQSALAEFVHGSGIPLITTPQSRGVVPEDDPLVLTGARSPAMKNADLVLVIGTRANWINAHLQPPRFSKDAQLVVVNLDPEEIGRGRVPTLGIQGDARVVLEQMTALAKPPKSRWQPWVDGLAAEDQSRADQNEVEAANAAVPIHPQRLCLEIRDFLPRDAVFVVDGHEILEFARRTVPSYTTGGYVTTGPNGCMGVGVPMAIGAKVAAPDRDVVVFMGDGGFGWNGLEFDTALRHEIPIVGIVGNNAGFTARPTAGEGGGRELGFQRYDKVVEALGGYGEFVEHPDEIRPALDRALASGRPALVNVCIDPDIPASGGLLGALGSTQATPAKA